MIRGLGIVDTINNLSTTTSVTASNGATLNPPEINTGTSGGSPFVTINSATEEDTMTATMGPNDASGTRTISFFDSADGASTTISLSGADSTLTFTGTNLVAKQSDGNLKVTGTNLQLDSIAATTTGDSSNLTFSSPGRNKHVDLGDITITGSLNSITGSGINLTGDIAVTGSVNKIQFLASNAAGFISIDTSGVTKTPLPQPLTSPSSPTSPSNPAHPSRNSSPANTSLTTAPAVASAPMAPSPRSMDFGPMEAAVDAAPASAPSKPPPSPLSSNPAEPSAMSPSINSRAVASFPQPRLAPKPSASKTSTCSALSLKRQILATGNIGTIKAASMSDTTIYAGINPQTDLSQTGGFVTQCPRRQRHPAKCCPQNFQRQRHQFQRQSNRRRDH